MSFKRVDFEAVSRYRYVEPYPGGRELRDYQKAAVQEVRAAWDRELLRPSVVMATGLGKSTVLARLAADHLDHPHISVRKRRRVLFLAHRHELLDQLRDSVLAVRPGTSVGIVQAGRNETDADVVIGSIQTLQKPERRNQIRDVGLVIVDECHHAVSRTYMETLSHFGVFADTLAVGVTATMDRMDQKKLADVWEVIAYEKGIKSGIADGHLVMPIGKAVVLDGLNLSDVKKSRGDYQDGELGKAIADVAVDVAKAVAVHTADRKRRIVFTPSIEAAETLADELEQEGLSPAVVIGSTIHSERRGVYAQLRSGEIDTIVSVGVLTEGFDLPAIDCVVMARPTQSAALYQQCIGRGLRPSPETGKVDCFVLDVCDANRIHTLRTLNKLVPDAPYSRAARDGDEIGMDLQEELDYADAELEAERAAVEYEGVLVDRDLFGTSHINWLRTDTGKRFVQADDWLVFLHPSGDAECQPEDDNEDAERFMVGIAAAKGSNQLGWRATDGRNYLVDDFMDGTAELADFTLEDAKHAAEEIVEELGGMSTERAASWRRTKAPSEKQIEFARKLGIREPELKSKARLSDEITMKLASRRLAPLG